MKKTYINPTLTVVEIKSQAILAGSYTEIPGSATEMNSGSFGTRRGRFSGWDEDFDSEE